MSDGITVHITPEALERAEKALGATEDPGQYIFDEADFGPFGGTPGASGRDRFAMTFTGHGPRLFLATFASGEPAQKPVAGPFSLEEMRFVPAGAQDPGNPEHGDPGMEPDPSSDVLIIRGKRMEARIAVTGSVGFQEEQRPICKVTVEMTIRRGGQGLVRELTGDESEDREILDTDLFLAIGRVSGRNGTLFLLRAAGAQQGNLFKDKDPWSPPEGVKERSLRRGNRKAVKALADAVSAAKPDGTPVDLEEVRAAYTADQALHLRTWDGGPVLVKRGFTVVYVLTLPADPVEPGAPEEGAPTSGKDRAGNQSEDA